MAGLLDTQNQHWASDKNAFGYRMLQKMGWKEGKGLGAKEDGATEHIRVKKRISASGIGVERNTAWDVPGAVATGLNDVLKGLQAVGAKVETEEGGDVQTGRGYYERRASGKNVRGYSKKELKEIFGGAEQNELKEKSELNGVGKKEDAEEKEKRKSKRKSAGDEKCSEKEEGVSGEEHEAKTATGANRRKSSCEDEKERKKERKKERMKRKEEHAVAKGRIAKKKRKSKKVR